MRSLKLQYLDARECEVGLELLELELCGASIDARLHQAVSIVGFDGVPDASVLWTERVGV